MKPHDKIKIITFVASPPSDMKDAVDNPFISGVIRTLSTKQAGNLVVKVSSVRDIDLELCKHLPADGKGRIRAQIVGHSMSGMLALGAHWFSEHDAHLRGFKFPYYVLDTNPAALGLLSKHAGKLSELMLVGCNIGSATSYGYAVSGRTLTYTLTELLRCSVLGADDVVAPAELDARGWYSPFAHRRGPKGWQWAGDAPPIWTEQSEPRSKVA
jgi:hypothetical protein